MSTESVRFTLRPCMLVSKPDPRRDFVRQVTAAPPEAIQQDVDTWMRALSLTNDPALLAIAWHEGDAFLVRTWRDGRTDTSGRPTLSLAVHALDPAPSAELAPFVLEATRASGPPSNAERDLTVHTGPTSEAWSALVAYSCDEAPVVTSTPASASWVLRHGPAPAWLALGTSVSTNRLPPGRGIVISGTRWQPPTWVAELPPTPHALPAFKHLPLADPSPMGRRQLLRALLDASPPPGLDASALLWFWQHAPARADVFERLSASQRITLATSGSLDADQLAEVVPVLSDADVGAIPSQVQASPRLRAAVVARLGPVAPELDPWRDPALVAAENAWTLDGRQPDAAMVRHLIEEGRAATWPLSTLYTALEHPEVLQEVRRRLAQAGTPADVLACLFEGGPPPNMVHPEAPPLPAELATIVTAATLWRMVRTLHDPFAWQGWVPLALVHADPAEPATPPAWLHVFCLATRTRQSADPQLMAWRRDGIAVEDTQALVRLGWGLGPRAARTAGLPATQADASTLETWHRLVVARLVSRADACQAWVELQDGPSYEGLVYLGMDPVWAALLDAHQPAPTQLPTTAPPEVGAMVARAAANRAWWHRWRGTLTASTARQLAALGTSVGLPHAALGALQHEPQDATSLAVIAPALPAACVFHQMLNAAQRGDGDAVNALLDHSPVLDEPLRAWLRGLLLEGRGTPVPNVSPPLRFALLPLLHPVREVLLPALASPDALPPVDGPAWQSLLAVLAAERLVPLQAPTGARQHPDHLASIAALPGWHGWALPDPS